MSRKLLSLCTTPRHFLRYASVLREAGGIRGLGRTLCEFIISFKHDPVFRIALIQKIMDKNRSTSPRNHVWMRIIRIFPVHFVLAHIHRQSYRNHMDMVFRWFFTFDTLQMRATLQITLPTPFPFRWWTYDENMPIYFYYVVATRVSLPLLNVKQFKLMQIFL